MIEMFVGLGLFVANFITAYSIIESDKSINTKLVWFIIITLLPFMGLIVYYLVKNKFDIDNRHLTWYRCFSQQK